MSDSWDMTLKSISLYLETIGYTESSEKQYCYNNNDNGNSFILIPIAKVRELRNLRHNSQQTPPVIFLIKGKQENPFRNNDALFPHTKEIYFGNPKYGNIEKAILFAELTNLKKPDQLVLDATSSDLAKQINNCINTLSNKDNKYLKKYYDTFVEYYFPDKNDITYVENIEFKANGDDIKKEDLEKAEKAYCKLNVIDYNEQVHRVKFELFRAPVPFPLQELVDAKEEIEDSVGWKNGKEGKTIKLFLIDNKTDKFKMENNKSTVCDVFEEFGIAHLFDIEMVGIGESEGFKSEYGRFDFKKFKDKKQLEELEDSEKEYYQKLIDHYKFSKIQTYEDLIYNKIKSSHFILLDFFLNKENTYLAFDFIRDISEIKKKKCDYSTTWYFITSAVYDSVVKYSQSGLLAEYYESTVVNVGDDPTNKKRQIIFVYKLLTFIQSRLRSFKICKDAIYNLMLNDEKENGKLVCCVISTNKNKKIAGNLENCEKDNCLKNMQTYIKRYLTEYDNIWSLFYYEENKKDYNDIAELLDDTIKKFLWLPEAEWQMVQHQIDYINAKLKDIGEGRKFSCNYINEEIRQRSEIY